MNTMLTELSARGLLAEATPGLADRLAQQPITGYVGFDPTADSLHVGSLIPVLGLAWLQRAGGRPIALVGGGTGLVGDPSGKRAERPMLDRETLARNVAGLRMQLGRFLDFSGPHGAILLDNAEWLGELRLLDFLRDTGKHFTVGYMLQKESVKSRLDTGISFTEFTYMLIQAYDFFHLFEAHGCELQMGGSDQWGNITAGIELIGRRLGRSAHGLVLPLLTTASGAKFGKTEAGNVWLDPAKTSPYRFHQFWLNTEDADVGRFLRYFSFQSLGEIDAAAARHAEAPERREGQRLLARVVTTMVHGAETTRRVEAASQALFGGSLDALDAEALEMIAAEVPTVERPADAVVGWPLVEALCETGLAASKSEARRGITGRGFSINGETITSADRMLDRGDVRGERYILLRKGKKHYAMVRLG